MSNWFFYKNIGAREKASWFLDLKAKMPSDNSFFILSMNHWSSQVWGKYLNLKVGSLGNLPSEIKNNQKGHIIFFDLFLPLKNHFEEVNLRRILDFSGGEIFIWIYGECDEGKEEYLRILDPYFKAYSFTSKSQPFKFSFIRNLKKKLYENSYWFENLKVKLLKLLRQKKKFVIVINMDWVLLKLYEILSLHGGKGQLIRRKEDKSEKEGEDFLLSYWIFPLELTLENLSDSYFYIHFKSYDLSYEEQNYWQFELNMIEIKR